MPGRLLPSTGPASFLRAIRSFAGSEASVFAGAVLAGFWLVDPLMVVMIWSFHCTTGVDASLVTVRVGVGY